MWLSQPARMSSATCSRTTTATSRFVSRNRAQPKATTAASRPSLSPKWWYMVGAVTPAASQMARVEASASAEWASRSAAASRIRVLTVMAVRLAGVYSDCQAKGVASLPRGYRHGDEPRKEGGNDDRHNLTLRPDRPPGPGEPMAGT